jgi:hypothetical protein
MKRFLVLVTATVVFMSCSNWSSPGYFSMLQGDWVSNRSEFSNRIRPFVFSFSDSLCSPFNPWYNYSAFSIKENVLTVQADSIASSEKVSSDFLILKVNEDSLVLQPRTAEGELGEPIRLGKIEAKNAMVPVEIFFASSGCFGSCPSLFLKVDSGNHVQFYGERYTDSTGSYTGAITKVEYNAIISRIHNLNIDSLKTNYEAGWTDDQTCAVMITAPGMQIHASVYGYDKEPVELRILMNYLAKLYKRIHLKKNALNEPEFIEINEEFKTIMPVILPPPVPPPPFK